jgi:aspartyl protease family protein
VAGLAALLAGPGWLPDAELVYRAVIVVVFGGSAILFVAHRLRGRLTQGVIYAGIWLGVVLVLVIGYAYRGALRDVRDRVVMEFMPGSMDWTPGTVRVSADRSGHYWVDALVNGVPVRFLVDTGATTVALTPEDARRVGFDLAKLKYSQTAQTAAGPMKVAPIRIDRIAIGQIELTDVIADVSQVSGGESLLGMSFLARLTGFSVEEGYLILRR